MAELKTSEFIQAETKSYRMTRDDLHRNLGHHTAEISWDCSIDDDGRSVPQTIELCIGGATFTYEARKG